MYSILENDLIVISFGVECFWSDNYFSYADSLLIAPRRAIRRLAVTYDPRPGLTPSGAGTRSSPVKDVAQGLAFNVHYDGRRFTNSSYDRTWLRSAA